VALKELISEYLHTPAGCHTAEGAVAVGIHQLLVGNPVLYLVDNLVQLGNLEPFLQHMAVVETVQHPPFDMAHPVDRVFPHFEDMAADLDMGLFSEGMVELGKSWPVFGKLLDQVVVDTVASVATHNLVVVLLVVVRTVQLWLDHSGAELKHRK
jgi:hypothetical protein